eukprot:TRINITY_DN2218_c0_g1_i1.p1 TRINITY_DN2218_c0_g1~~TRINITY_DN2218_c0_g1_i1.p1  ORF type:complete len:795 (+),score=145.22 TRINITY_DN2218_c0_g1_i1:40-2424(+)
MELLQEDEDRILELTSLLTEHKNGDVITHLQELRKIAKGNDEAKGLIGESVSALLVDIIVDEEEDDEETRIEAAKLLRSITVYRKNKQLGSKCGDIIDVIVQTDSRPLKLALTATLWNLAALAPNRAIIVENNGLNVLADLLKSGDLGLQREAAGCIRNITLDDSCKDQFVQSGVLNDLIVIASDTSDISLLLCVCGALRNLSVTHSNRALMSTELALQTFSELLENDSNKVQTLCLTILCNLSEDKESKKLIGKSNIVKILVDLTNSTTLAVRDKSEIALRNLNSEDISMEEIKLVETALNRNGNLITDLERYTQLLRDLDLDGNLKWSDINLIKKVGEGVYGDVWMADYNGHKVACKVIKKELTPKDIEKTLEELRLMKTLKHPNITLLMGSCLNDKNQITIITEFAGRGDLKDVLPQVTDLSQRLKLALDIAKGLSWLASNNIVHRDLKLPNLLVSDDFTVKIADFGLSIQLDGSEITRFGGNVKYSAPEILRARYNESITVYPYCEKTDVYSFGLMLWEILTLKPVYVRPKDYKGKKGLAIYVLEGNRPEMQINWPQSLCDLLTSCWHENPDTRPTFRNIISNWEKLELDLLCPDTLGRQVCSRIWGNDRHGSVSFEDFLDIFVTLCMETDIFKKKQPLLKYMSSLLCADNYDDSVTMDRFCNMVGWFGPLHRSSNCNVFFTKMREIFSKKYFHSVITETKTKNLLRRQWDVHRKPFYLVRLSRSDVGEFVLSYITTVGEIIEHKSVLNVNGKYWVSEFDEEFDSWKKIVAEFKREEDIGSHVPKSAVMF